MTGPARLRTIAEMQGRDLLRRRRAVALLVALPLLFYASQLPGDDVLDPLIAGGVGMGWVAAGAALFSALGSRRVDPRLVLAGYRPSELLLGRLGLLDGMVLLLAVAFGALMTVASDPSEPAVLMLALVTTGLIAVPLGLLIAAVLPQELEGTMALIGTIGIEMAIQPPSPVLPLYGPLRLMERAAGGAVSIVEPLAHAVGVAVLLLLLALVLLARRLPAAAAGSGQAASVVHASAGDEGQGSGLQGRDSDEAASSASTAFRPIGTRPEAMPSTDP